jgi:hypothetical protein
MAFNINTFRQNIDKYGTMQTNKFDVSFAIPPIFNRDLLNVQRSSLGVLSTITKASELISLRAEQVKLPGASFDLQKTNTIGYGINQNFPVNVHFTDNTMTFIDDKNNTLLKFFNLWMNGIMDFNGNSSQSAIPLYRFEYKENYAVQITVNVYNQEAQNSTQLIMKQAYPIFVNDINLGWSNNADLFKVVVGFTFTEWYISLNNVPIPIPSTTASQRSLPTFTPSPPSTLG